MTWFLIALIAPALWSATNHLDKYLVSKYLKGGGNGALIIFSALIGVLVMPVVAFFDPSVLNIPVKEAALIMGGGAVYVISILLYLNALQKDEASIVVPLFQAVPVFAFILGYVVLGETLSVRQLLGSIIIVLGGILLSLDLVGTRPRIKSSILVMMLVASLLIAMNGLIFKVVAVETTFWTATFWGYMGDILMGVIFLCFVRPYREEFLRVWQMNDRGIIALNGVNELLTVSGNLAFRYATLLAPLALVATANGFQPLFVFLYGTGITLLLPHVGTENITRKHLLQKGIVVALMLIGTLIMHT